MSVKAFPITNWAFYSPILYATKYIKVTGIVASKGQIPKVYVQMQNSKNGIVLCDIPHHLYPHDTEQWEIGQLYGGN